MNENIEYLVGLLRKQEAELQSHKNAFEEQRQLLIACGKSRNTLQTQVNDLTTDVKNRQAAWELQCATVRKLEVRYEDCRNQLSRAEEDVAKINISFEDAKACSAAWVRRAEKAERLLRDEYEYNFFAVPDYGPAKAFLMYRCPKAAGKPEIWNPEQQCWITTRFQSTDVLVKKFGKQLVESNAQEIDQCIQQA